MSTLLASIPAWDGQQRAEHLFGHYVGAKETPATLTASRNFLGSVITRQRLPGAPITLTFCLTETGKANVQPTRFFDALLPKDARNSWPVKIGKTDAMERHTPNGLAVVRVDCTHGARRNITDIRALADWLKRDRDMVRPNRVKIGVEQPRSFVPVVTAWWYSDAPDMRRLGHMPWVFLDTPNQTFEDLKRDAPQIWAEAFARRWNNHLSICELRDAWELYDRAIEKILAARKADGQIRDMAQSQGKTYARY